MGLLLVAVTLYLPDFHPVSPVTTFFFLFAFLFDHFYFSTQNLNLRVSPDSFLGSCISEWSIAA